MGKSKSNLAARLLTENEYELWSRLVIESSGGSVYSLPEYLDVLCSTAGGGFRIIGAFKGDDLVGGIALYEMHDHLGRYVSHRLLLYYNGLVLRDYDSKYPGELTARGVAAQQAIADCLTTLGYPRMLIRNRHPITDLRVFQNLGWRVWPGYSLVVDISDIDEAWNRIEQNLRRLVKRCEQADVTFGSDDDFDSFYRMHLATNQRKGAPVYLPEAAFKAYFQKLQKMNLVRLCQARLPDGQSIASQMVLLGKHPTSHTVTAASDAAHMKMGSTPYLRWKVFEDLHRLGYTANDLTDASLNEVTRFKSQLGGELVTNLNIQMPESRLFRLRESVIQSAKRMVGGLYMKLRGQG